jgi:hypothetical protein
LALAVAVTKTAVVAAVYSLLTTAVATITATTTAAATNFRRKNTVGVFPTVFFYLGCSIDDSGSFGFTLY